MSSPSVRRRHPVQRAVIRFFLILFLIACVGAFLSIALLNRRAPDAGSSTWRTQAGEMEILAPAAQVTAPPRGASGGGDGEMPPFLATREPEVTQAPTQAPTAAGEAPAEPTAQPEVSATETAQNACTTITLTAVGDCTLGGDIPSGFHRAFDSTYNKYGPDYFFQNMRELFESDDLTIVNLEGPLTTSNEKRKGRKFNFRGKPEYVEILSGSSVEIANVANNHAMDYGEAGFAETVDVLTRAGIGASGFSNVYFTTVKGVRICSMGFTEWAYTQEQIEKAVHAERGLCDLLIVSMHWGEEGKHEATATQKKLGRAIIDAGADVVIGTHPHVYGGIERYNGKYIVYSLGNFCFGGNRNPAEKDCVIFQQTFNVSPLGQVSDGGINVIPARVSSVNTKNDFQPIYADAARAETQLKKIAKISNVDDAELTWMEGALGQTLGLVLHK